MPKTMAWAVAVPLTSVRTWRRNGEDSMTERTRAKNPRHGPARSD